MFEGDVVDHVKDFISVRHDENLIFFVKIKLQSTILYKKWYIKRELAQKECK
jgi:hypothetical protein